MKKGILIVALILGCVLLSGCSLLEEKVEVLTCSKGGYSSGISFTEIHDLTFKGKKVKEYTMTLKFDLSRASSKEAFNQAVENLKKEYAKAIEPGVTVSVFAEDPYAVAKFTMNPALFDGILNYNNYDLRNIFNARFSLKELKPDMEGEGYTCSAK